jgi:hypothetical protein
MVRPETLDDLIYAAGIPLTKLAGRAKIDPKTILSLRRGVWKDARVATIAKLARALGVDPARVRAACEASRRAAE